MFETERLIIREMCPEDLDGIYAVYDGNDLRYMEGLYDDKNQEYEYIKDYQRYIYNFYDFGIWLFEHKESGEIIGRGGVEYKVRDDGSEAVELGYIVKKSHQGQGYAYEALSAILSYVEETFEVKEVSAFIHPDNAPSIGLVRKLGFEKSGGDINTDNENIRFVRAFQ